MSFLNKWYGNAPIEHKEYLGIRPFDLQGFVDGKLEVIHGPNESALERVRVQLGYTPHLCQANMGSAI